MADEIKPIAQLHEKAEARRSDQYLNTYVNHAKIGMSKWDMGLTVGYLDDIAPGITAPLEQCHIHMTPAFAKALAADLAKAVEQYELLFGTVSLPVQSPLLAPAKESKKK